MKLTEEVAPIANSDPNLFLYLNRCMNGLTNDTVIADSVQCFSSYFSQHYQHNASHENHHAASYHLSNYFEFAVEFVNSIAGLIVLFAVILACFNLTLVACNTATGFQFSIVDPLHSSHKGQKENSVLRIRVILGEQIALALALLVASDILDTVLKPSHAYDLLDVVKMGFVTVLRTGLAYFLAKEIKELEEGGTILVGKLSTGDINSFRKRASDSDSDRESIHKREKDFQCSNSTNLSRSESSNKLRRRKN